MLAKRRMKQILNLKPSRLIKFYRWELVEGSRPEFESFRYELWKDLKENNWTFDFIGTQSDNASNPSFNSYDFDIDHEGRGGWISG